MLKSTPCWSDQFRGRPTLLTKWSDQFCGRPTISYFAILLLLACGSENNGPAPTQRTAAEAGAVEQRLIGELSPEDDLAGRQRNAIINRAIDRNYDVYAAPEGYFYEIVEPGEFGKLVADDLVAAHYVGTFLDGTEFDNSRKRGEKLRFTLGSLIDAWNLGLTRISPGGSIRILTPSSLAYGSDGLTSPRGDTLVPADRPLEFLITDIELLEE